MAAPWHRPDATGVSDIDRLRSLLNSGTLPDNPQELARLFPDRPYNHIVRQINYLKHPDHPGRPLMMNLSDARVGASSMPESKKPILNEQFRLPGPSALVLSDIHVPYQAHDFVNKCVHLAVTWHVDTLCLTGDLFDIEVYSKYDHDPDSSLEEELFQGEQMLEYFANRFDTIKITLGNHEQRFFGPTLHRQLRANRFLRMLTSRENIEISSFEWMEMESPLGLYRFIHPMSASMISGRVPAMIASRRFTDSHIISGHGHLKGMVKTEDGKRWAIDSGCCMDFDRVPYVTLRVNTRPRMNLGAVLIKNGYPYCLEPDVDWDELAKLYN